MKKCDKCKEEAEKRFYFNNRYLCASCYDAENGEEDWGAMESEQDMDDAYGGFSD